MKRLPVFFIAVIIFLTSIIPAGAITCEGNGWINGTKGWSYMTKGTYSDGWNKIDKKWYYFYKDTNLMAHDTIIDGDYIGSDGVWTTNMPDDISKIIENDVEYINSNMKNIEWSFYPVCNIRFKDLSKGSWNVPDIYGNVYWLQGNDMDYMGYFVSGDSVYALGNQGGTDIYKVENNKIVQSIPYNYGGSYKWR